MIFGMGSFVFLLSWYLLFPPLILFFFSGCNDFQNLVSEALLDGLRDPDGRGNGRERERKRARAGGTQELPQNRKWESAKVLVCSR